MSALTQSEEFIKWCKVAEENNISREIFKQRCHRDWSFERAATTPERARKCNKNDRKYFEQDLIRMYRAGYNLTPKQKQFLKENDEFRRDLLEFRDERISNFDNVRLIPDKKKVVYSRRKYEGFVAKKTVKNLIIERYGTLLNFTKHADIGSGAISNVVNRRIFASDRLIEHLEKILGVDKRDLFDFVSVDELTKAPKRVRR